MRFGKQLITVFCVVGMMAIGISAQREEGYYRFVKLTGGAPAAYQSGDPAAASMANELMSVTPSFESDWNYGNAVHSANLVLGRIAFDAGDIKEAKRLLLASVATDGLPYGRKTETRQKWKASPQLDSFGPDMALANVLLTKGEKETVLKYLDLFSKFWSNDNGKLAEWRSDIEKGQTPSFGPNLIYVFGKYGTYLPR